MRKNLSAKPGAERAPFRPDVILHFSPTEPCKLLDFLFAAMPDRKRTTVKDYLKHRQVMVNGKVTTQFDQALTPGDAVAVNASREFQTLRNPRLSIVYEDDDIVVVNKGYGLLSVGTDKIKTGTAYSILRDYLKRVDPRNKVFIVHRLDQHTSGLMMFAKNVRAKEAMQHNWNNMVLERTYVAVLEGIVDSDQGEIRSYLGETSRFEVYSSDSEGDGKPAVTRYRILKRGSGRSLAEFSLNTGRKNQIRVHAAKELGHPIVGDKKYGAATSPINRIALHARTLRFAHPVTRKDMRFETPIPLKFSSLVR